MCFSNHDSANSEIRKNGARSAPLLYRVLVPLLVLGAMSSLSPLAGAEHGMVPILGGEFEMGDHHGLGGEDPSHPTDELPLHVVSLDSFNIASTETSNLQFNEFLNAAMAQGEIELSGGLVFGSGTEPFCETSESDSSSKIAWDGSVFAALAHAEDHPVTHVRWTGAAAYCNWLSTESGFEQCYDTSTWQSVPSCSGYRLPTEAEWEYAARGGRYDPYSVFPWGDDENLDGTLANWPGSGDPFENGHLLRACTTRGPLSTGGGEGGRIEEYDWDGNLVWEFDYSTDEHMSHHDIKPLPNGNVLVLAVEKKTYEEAIAAGFDPNRLTAEVQQMGHMIPDMVVEVQPTRPVGGNVVWEWHVWDHLIQDYDAAKENYGNVSEHPELIDADGTGSKIRRFWNHMNSIDYSSEFNQIMLSVRGSNEIWVIDHSTTTSEAAAHTGGTSGKGGDLLYRWGNPVTYESGLSGDQQLFEQHDANWIEAEYPGAGNIIIFNNGNARGYSTVDEIMPPVDEQGRYPISSGEAFAPDQPQWTYEADPRADLYSEAISGAQRLPNGNTLICDGTHGVLFEVTSAGETVWRYVNPVINSGPLTQGEEIPLDGRGHQYNAVFKVRRYPNDYVGLVGRDLTPGDRIEYDARPLADFSYSPIAPVTGQVVSFSDASTGEPTSWMWDFGDGSTSSQQNPNHIFEAAETYTVILQASNSSGSDTTWIGFDVSQGTTITAPDLSIPAAARLAGAGAYFTSRIDVFNASLYEITVNAVFTPRADAGGEVRSATFNVDGRQMLTIDDPLAEWFGFDDGEDTVGSLMFTVSDGFPAALMIQSMVVARHEDGSEYGQAFPAVNSADALAAGDTAYLSTNVDAERTRVNFGVMALADGTVLSVQPEDPIGSALAGATTLALDLGESVQINDLAGSGSFSLGDAENYLLGVDVLAGRAVVYASVLDGYGEIQGTSDPTTILPVATGVQQLTLLELGPIQGYDEFSGSASISNLSHVETEVRADFYRRDTAGVEASAFVTIAAGDTIGYEDLVGALFGTTGVGTVVLSSNGGAKIMANGREFSILRDQSGEIVGTAGQLIPGMADDELLQPGVKYHVLGLRQRDLSTGVERSHVAAFNPGNGDEEIVEIELALYDGATGAYEGITRLSIDAGKLVQMNSIIEVVNPAQDGGVKRLEITVDGMVFLKAFRNNANGDPVTIDALPE